MAGLDRGGGWPATVRQPGAGRVRRQPGHVHRRAGRARPDLVARVDTGDGPMAETELSLAREAEAYRALAGHGGAHPPPARCSAPTASPSFADRAPGTHELHELADDASACSIFDDYLDALAELHAVPMLATWTCPASAGPLDAASHATNELDLWADDPPHPHEGQPWPLAEFAFGGPAPQARHRQVSRTVLCHGDVGPGNFLHDGQRVTALLDWEFAHLGDPMDDLGWWVFRGHDMAGGGGDLAAQLQRWSEHTGLARATPGASSTTGRVVMLRWLVAVAATIENGGSGLDRSVHFALGAAAGRCGCRGPWPACSAWSWPSPRRMTPHRWPRSRAPAPPCWPPCGADLRDVIAPSVADAEARRRLGAAQIYLSHLEALDRARPWPGRGRGRRRRRPRSATTRPAPAADGHASWPSDRPIPCSTATAEVALLRVLLAPRPPPGGGLADRRAPRALA